MANNYEMLVRKIDECRTLARKAHAEDGFSSWQMEIEELYHDVGMSFRAETLKAQWAPFFLREIVSMLPSGTAVDFEFSFESNRSSYYDAIPDQILFTVGSRFLWIPIKDEGIEATFRSTLSQLIKASGKHASK